MLLLLSLLHFNCVVVVVLIVTFCLCCSRCCILFVLLLSLLHFVCVVVVVVVVDYFVFAVFIVKCCWAYVEGTSCAAIPIQLS